MQLKPLTDDQVNGIVSDAIDDAVAFVSGDVTKDRLLAMKYYRGEVSMGHEEGRSKVVATKCRDTVRAIKPALLRTFMATDKPVEFIPMSQDDVEAAEQATKYVQWKFNQVNGYRLIYNAIHDALTQKTGILKVFYEDHSDVEIDNYTGLSDDVFAAIASDEDITILEHTSTPGQMGLMHDMKVSYTKPGGSVSITSVPPEDFFVNSEASTLEDAVICGQRNGDMRVGDLVKMGFDFEEVIKYAGSESDAMLGEADQERRRGALRDDDADDPAMRKVLVTEAYMKVDIEGTGIAKLYQFICAGTDYKVIRKELADDKPFAVFEVDPEPHTFFGRSLVDLLITDQDAATAMLRGLLDNVALTNTPRMQVVGDNTVNIDDLLNNEIGGIVRTKVAGALIPLDVPFTAGQTLPAMQYFDEIIEGKTGVSRASMGLDPDTLQGTTAAGINAMTQASSGQNELMARNLAEGGMRQLFRLMMRLIRQHTDAETMMRLDGKFVPVDPRSWNADMDLIANVGLGTGGEVEREMVLREILQQQTQIWSSYGPSNGLVTMTGMRNTLADIAKMGGIQNSDRYWSPMDEAREKQLNDAAAQAASQQQQATDPNQAFIQVEQMKAQLKSQSDQQKAQTDMQKAVADHQRKMMEMAKSDDFARDKMAQDALFQAAELLGKFGLQINQDQLKAEQAAPRQF